MSGDFVTEMHERVLVIRLNRPERYNAWITDMRERMCDVLEEAKSQDEVGSIVFTGTGERAFCAGQDLAETERFVDGKHVDDWIARLKRFYDLVRTIPKPIVGALNGVAAGSGFQFVLLMDVVVAHRGVRLGQPEVNSGIPSILGPWIMRQSLGVSRTRELALTGRLMDAEECWRLGMVHHLVEPKAVIATALDIARDLAAKPSVAMRVTKDYLRRADDEDYERAWAWAGDGQAEAFATGQPQQVMREFFELRRRRKSKQASGLSS
jgi:enoyl-CoA hydratase